MIQPEKVITQYNSLFMIKYAILLAFLLLGGCHSNLTEQSEQDLNGTDPPPLSIEKAQRLSTLPLNCIEQEYPNKLGQTLSSADDLATPSTLHPAFYGCFDWHSAVHGHWSLVALLKQFPNLKNGPAIRKKLQQHISAGNVLKEVSYFDDKNNRNFERTYGWVWLLKLALELNNWDDPLARELEKNLRPLSDLLVQKYLEFLPKLNYPIRSGTHPNTAFGLSFAYDYALQTGADSLINLIKNRCKDYYLTDTNCPLTWEPSGSDFLSPCLQEVDIMRRVLTKEEFMPWLKTFLPQIFEVDFHMAPGLVTDREDGQLVHLDGVNFSRAWCLYGLADYDPNFSHLLSLAHQHINHTLPAVTDDHYEGGHWLASFAILALKSSQQ